MRKYLAPGIVIALASAGLYCHLAFGGEGAGVPSSGNLLEAVLMTYGPLGGIAFWFMRREDKRDKRLYELLEKSTEAMTTVANKLDSVRADNEKTRLAVYQLKDVVLERARQE